MITPKPKKAGGLPSLQSTAKQLLRSRKLKDNLKNLVRLNQTDGFDCPGCAWGDQKNGTFQFCENGAKAVAWEATDRKVDAEFFARYSVQELRQQSDYWLEAQGRLAEPMRFDKASGHYQTISWDEAFSVIAHSLKGLADPNQLELYTSGRASNEASFLYQLFGRMFGTNNFPDCSNMCHEASGVALTESIGVGKGTVTLKDFEQAEAIFVYGQNPGTNHPRMLNALRKASKRGATIVTFNNLKEVGLEKFASPQDPIELITPVATQISHQYLTPKLGGDMAAVRGIVKHLVETNMAFDQVFIAQHCQGFDDYIAAVNRTEWSSITEQSGLSRASLARAAETFAKADNVISTWAMGITQHKHSVSTIQELVNLHLLFGQIGKAGAGLCPVRGHSNVQGNRTMGINEKPKPEFLAQLGQVFGFNAPTQPGHNVNAMLHAFDRKQSQVLIALGGNIAAASPDSVFTHSALKNAALTVQISTKLNRSHLMVGDDAIILPCLGRTEIDLQASGEQSITVEDTFSMVHASKGSMQPLSPLCQSETAIVAQIAQATLGSETVDWQSLMDDYHRIRDRIAEVLPPFNAFNDKIAQPGGFYLSNAAADRQWLTPSGKANFMVAQLPAAIVDLAAMKTETSTKQTVFVLQTLRSHDQFNTTIYGLDDRYRGIFNERKVLFINADDIRRLGLKDGGRVTLRTIWHDNIERSVSGFTLVEYDIPKGNVAAYYPETNPLVPIDLYGDKSFTPASKSIPIVIDGEALIPVKSV